MRDPLTKIPCIEMRRSQARLHTTVTTVRVERRTVKENLTVKWCWIVNLRRIEK